MQKTTKKTTDFFSLYRSSQLRKYFLSGGIAVFAAFSIVSVSHGDIDMQGLMASVANVSNTQHYDADLIMTRHEGALSITFGAKATKVDQVEFTLLSDPTKFKSLTSSNSAVHITGEKETGAYHVTINMHGGDILPGSSIAELVAEIDSGVPIALTDTEFISGGQRYSITNK
jgi:hypothetical protein